MIIEALILAVAYIIGAVINWFAVTENAAAQMIHAKELEKRLDQLIGKSKL